MQITFHVRSIDTCRLYGRIHRHLLWRGGICADLQDMRLDLSESDLAATAPAWLIGRRTRLSTFGDRAFPVAAACVWNVTSRLRHHCLSSAVAFHDCIALLYCCAWELTLSLSDTLIALVIVCVLPYCVSYVFFLVLFFYSAVFTALTASLSCRS